MQSAASRTARHLGSFQRCVSSVKTIGRFSYFFVNSRFKIRRSNQDRDSAEKLSRVSSSEITRQVGWLKCQLFAATRTWRTKKMKTTNGLVRPSSIRPTNGSLERQIRSERVEFERMVKQDTRLLRIWSYLDVNSLTGRFSLLLSCTSYAFENAARRFSTFLWRTVAYLTRISTLPE